jgi:septum formation topological specificity factor MinE
MKVDFNNLRRKLGDHYNSVIETLNNPNRDEDDLRDHLNSLRSDVVGIICCYEEGNPDCVAIDMELLSAFVDED